VGASSIKAWARAASALWLVGSLAACEREDPRAPEPVPPPVPPAIARADLFGDPAREEAQLSPRGDRVAFLAPRDGVMNLWVLSVDAMGEARPVTDERTRGIQRYVWARDNATLLYLLDEGDERWRLYAVSADGGEPRALTPAGVRAEIAGLSLRDPGAVVVLLTPRGAIWPDLARIDIASGARTIVQRNSGGFSRFVLDRDNTVRLAVRPREDGGAEIFTRTAEGWRPLLTIPFEDAMSSQTIAFEEGGASFLMLDSTGRDRTALVRVDAATGAKTVLGESARADVVDVWLDPATSAPEAFATEYLRREWRALDPDAQADLDFLDRQLDGEFDVVSRSADDARWIVVEAAPTTPVRTHLYDRADREGRRVSLLFRHRPNLDQAPLQPMTPIEIEARDGLTLVSYLTLPIGSDANGDGRPETPAPLVLTPYDAPWGRSSYGFDSLHQWLANRGYAALSVNVRGSSGFGKAFLNAGNGQWGARVREDLLDAVQWAVENGVAQPDRVAIVGRGFGGYAALAGLVFSPDRFRCAASFGGPLNLQTWLDASPAVQREEFYLRVGDPRTPAGRQAIREASPLARPEHVAHPLLLAVGGRDARAPRADADAFAQALQARGAPVTYLAFPNEGPELTYAPNRLAYHAVLDQFLGDCLGGRVEPVGAALEGAQLEAYQGAASVPGLSAFSRRPTTVRAPVQTLNPDGAAAPAASPARDAMSPAQPSLLDNTLAPREP